MFLCKGINNRNMFEMFMKSSLEMIVYVLIIK